MWALALVATAAHAEDAVIERVVVKNRLFDVGGRIEVGASLGFQPVTKLTDHWTLTGSGALNLSNALAFEARGLLAYTRQTGLATRIAQQFLQRDPSAGIQIADDLTDLWQMRGNLTGAVRWSPIYGKISLLAELPVHFQAYLALGGGAGSFVRQSLVYCRQVTSRTDGTCGDWLSESRLTGLVTGAAGMRFFLSNNNVLRFEVRDYAFPDAFLVNIDRTVAEAGGATGEPGAAGLTHLVLFDLGYSFVF